MKCCKSGIASGLFAAFSGKFSMIFLYVYGVHACKLKTNRPNHIFENAISILIFVRANLGMLLYLYKYAMRTYSDISQTPEKNK